MERIIRIFLILLLGIAIGYAWKTTQIIQEDPYIILETGETHNMWVDI